MAENPDQDRPGQPGVPGMLGWLGFFLLVFVVTGLAFYFAGNSGKVAPDKPTLATQQ
jgi:hypothetical protein